MKIKFFDIDWDTDGDEVCLPAVVWGCIPDNEDVVMEGADFLSDHYGYCVFGFAYEVQE